jgi:hypothetical protein
VSSRAPRTPQPRSTSALPPAHVRISVTSHTRRIDLVLPGHVPVAELVPELARSVGLLEPDTAYAGYRLMLGCGRTLRTDRGLVAQGAMDGDVITVVAAVDDRPPTRYDDAAEAMAHIIERDLEPLDAEAGERLSLWSAVLLLLVGVCALSLCHGSRQAGALGALTSLVLVAGAVWLSRARAERVAAAVVAVMGCLYAMVGALSWTWAQQDPGGSVAVVGCAALAAGLIAALGLAGGRVLLFPVVVVGAVCLATGVLMRFPVLDPAALVTVVLAVLVTGAGAFPRLASAVVNADASSACVEDTAEPASIDTALLAAQASTAHEILVSVTATVGVLLVLLAPVAVSCGPAGCAVAILSCAVTALRTRHLRAKADVLVGLVSGVLGAASTALSVLWLHPGWRSTAAAVIPVAGLLVLVAGLRTPAAPLRRWRLDDRLESIALIILVPMVVVVATGASFQRG